MPSCVFVARRDDGTHAIVKTSICACTRLTTGAERSQGLKRRDVSRASPHVLQLQQRCIYIYTYTHAQTHARTHTHAHTCTHTHTHMHVHMHTCTDTRVHTHTHTHTHKHAEYTHKDRRPVCKRRAACIVRSGHNPSHACTVTLRHV